MRPILSIALMESRRVAGRYVVPTLAIVAFAAAWGLFLSSRVLSCRCGG